MKHKFKEGCTVVMKGGFSQRIIIKNHNNTYLVQTKNTHPKLNVNLSKIYVHINYRVLNES